ncbi:MAG: SpoIIE family protein phosphatase [Bacteroidetes bacterium]|nr:SpoIIE family protein phosphatase [Bacteroidota bacterium]
MNPYSRFKNWIIGDALASTQDPFEKVRIDVLFSFALFFFFANLPYVIITFSMSLFHLCVGLFSSLALLCVIMVMRIGKTIKPATILYVSVHSFLNIFHLTINNGDINGQGMLFMILIIIFSFLMLDRMWGWIFTCFIGTLLTVGAYNVSHNHSLFLVPEKYHDPVVTQGMTFLILLPLLINAYLASKFVKAKQSAEKQIHDQKIQLEVNNKILALKNEDVLSSIAYAKKIQYAVLPNEENIYRSIPLSFIVYHPRDIVSGDFFWFHEIDRDNYILACADCTGHGVPGAFMTVIGSNALTQIITENRITSPSEILSQLDDRVTSTLKQERSHYGLIQDGMDISLVKVNKAKKEFVFTSAKRPAIFIHENEMRELKGSKNSIGGLRSEKKSFREITVSYEEDDMLYLFTDGVVDQFGGPSNKKFTSKRLRELLMNVHALPVAEQKTKISAIIEEWKNNNEQTDDVCLIGIRF